MSTKRKYKRVDLVLPYSTECGSCGSTVDLPLHVWKGFKIDGVPGEGYVAMATCKCGNAILSGFAHSGFPKDLIVELLNDLVGDNEVIRRKETHGYWSE